LLTRRDKYKLKRKRMLKPMQQSSRDMEVRKDLVQERNSIIREICQRYNVMDAMIIATTKRMP
jgi:hypothetical protein